MNEVRGGVMVHVSRGVLVTKILLVIHLSDLLWMELQQDEVLEDADHGVVEIHVLVGRVDVVQRQSQQERAG